MNLFVCLFVFLCVCVAYTYILYSIQSRRRPTKVKDGSSNNTKQLMYDEHNVPGGN